MKGDQENVLVEKSLNGSEKAFRTIIEDNTAIVFSAVRAVIGNNEDIDDLVQDIFIRIFRGLSGFRGGSRLSTWIYRIARNEAINSKAKRRDETVSVETVDLSGPIDERPDRMFFRRQENLHIRELVSKLDDKYREVIELRYLAERSYTEISEIMEIPLGSVKTYIHRARQELKDMMSSSNISGKRGGQDE